MKIVAYILLSLIVALSLWIRFSPSDPARWHIAPADAADPGAGGVRLVGGDAIGLEAAPDRVLIALNAIASEQPRVRVLAQSDAPARVTFIARSKWVGFPDYITFELVPDGAGTRMEVLSRLRFGQSDLGVNSARLDDWLKLIRDALRRQV